ncbi:MAG TPA: response regulator [Dongiaceae bacterium]|nr:response regulator [Dongiaceae bacterium]
MKREAKTLIVDDSKAVLRFMENNLRDIGVLDITKAGDGLQATKLFREALQGGTPFSLVFLDVVMPEMDGQEALKRMRAMEKDAGISGGDKATIVMATSLNSPNDMMDALVGGDCSDYLVKPFDIGDLRAILVKYGFTI